MATKILIVDDDPDILSGLTKRLEWLGYNTISARDGAEALAVIQQEAPALVLLDLELPLLSGLDVLKRLNGRGTNGGLEKDKGGDESRLPIIIMTAFGTINRAVEAMKLGACDFITKPFDPDHLGLVIQNVLERQALRREVKHLRSDAGARYEAIVTESRKMAAIVDEVRRVAMSEAVILLQGETGTGKELFARSIHRWSARRHKPFMVVNCAALPEHLLENELFGHERGAFTGATHMQEGKIEAADGGTVFLDEIGDLPVALQSRFLRLLQDREFHRVGGTQQLRVDVRFVAATNKQLSNEVKQGRFREDLFYRLNVLPVIIPPLRERLEDIPRLAAHIIDREVGRHGVKRAELSSCALEALSHYHWPGNIREMENVLARAVILADGQPIEGRHLNLPAIVASQAGAPTAEASTLAYHVSMDSHSRWLLTEALRRSGGNQTKAAALLDLQRTYLTKLLKRKGISPKPPDRDLTAP
jgi:DNA-binding NtrC family response regulator